MKNLLFLFTVGLAKSTFDVSEEDFANLVKQVQLLEATVEGLEDQNASTIKQIADLEAAAEDQEDKIQALESQVKTLEEENEILSEKVSRLEVSNFLLDRLQTHFWATRGMDSPIHHNLWAINVNQ